MSKRATASQTVGPYFHGNLRETPVLSSEDIPGDKIVVAGLVLDGAGNHVSDAMIEVWQANSRGKYDHPEDDQDKQTTPGFKGFGRKYVDDQGRFEIATIKPGPVAWRDGGEQAPHINITVFARGVLRRMATRVYFGDEASNAEDPVLKGIGDAARRETLIARPDPARPGRYLWDIVLQGKGETVFFDL